MNRPSRSGSAGSITNNALPNQATSRSIACVPCWRAWAIPKTAWASFMSPAARARVQRRRCWRLFFAVSIITSISYDHTQLLGNTLSSIAMEKAGIVKPGRPALSGARDPEAREVIAGICRERQAPLAQLGRDFQYVHEPGRIGNGDDRL